jgi:hypothetical protein
MAEGSCRLLLASAWLAEIAEAPSLKKFAKYSPFASITPDIDLVINKRLRISTGFQCHQLMIYAFGYVFIYSWEASCRSCEWPTTSSNQRGALIVAARDFVFPI